MNKLVPLNTEFSIEFYYNAKTDFDPFGFQLDLKMTKNNNFSIIFVINAGLMLSIDKMQRIFACKTKISLKKEIFMNG